MKKKLFPKPIIGIDLGATKVLTLVVAEDGSIAASHKQDVPQGEPAEKTVKLIASTVNAALDEAGMKKKQIAAVGIGAPSPIEITTGMAYYAPNLGWKNVPLKALMEKQISLPVFPDNDVNMGTYGELVFGAGRGVDNMLGFFVGTGIGGGVIIDGNIIHGKNMTGGELGHIIVISDGPYCGCGNRGCLEAVSSRIAIARDIKSAMEKGAETVLSEILKGKPDRIKSGALKKAYQAGDPLVTSILDRSAFYLGIAVASAINVTGPERVVIGGGVFEALGKQLMPIVRNTTALHTFGPAGEGVDIVLAELGDNAVALGAAANAAKCMF